MVNDLYNKFSYPLYQVYAIHLDCDGVIFVCGQIGINIVEIGEEL